MADSEGKRVLVVQTSGVDRPRRTYAPIYYAMTAAAMEMEVMMWFTMEGTSQLIHGEAEKIELESGSGVTLRTMIERAMDAGVKFSVCQQSMALFRVEPKDIVDNVKILGAASIIDLTLDYDVVMYF